MTHIPAPPVPRTPAKKERPAWKEPILWLAAFALVIGLGLAVEASGAQRLFADEKVRSAMDRLRSRLQPEVVGWFESVFPPRYFSDLPYLEQEFGIQIPNFPAEAQRIFQQQWQRVVAAVAGAAAFARDALAGLVTLGLVLALLGLVLTAVVGGWSELPSTISGSLLVTGLGCLLLYWATASVLNRAAARIPAEGLLVAQAWTADFMSYQLAVGIPLLILGAAGPLLLFLLSSRVP